MIRERLSDYETVIQRMNCGLVAEDNEGRVVFVNERFLEWTGYEREEVEGQPVSMLVPEELRQLLEDDLAAAHVGDIRARLLAVRRKDSTTFPAVTIPERFMNSEGEVDGHFSIVVDLGAILTAKQVGPVDGFDVRSNLSRIALELHSISVCVAGSGGTAPAIPLHHPDLQGLSPREQEVLALLVSGTRVPAIAARLHISQHTVRNHLKAMFRKLDVGSQSDLIERVRALGNREGEGTEAASPAPPA